MKLTSINALAFLFTCLTYVGSEPSMPTLTDLFHLRTLPTSRLASNYFTFNQRKSNAANWKDINQRTNVKHSFVESFINDYRKNFHLLKLADPCTYNPCGANTYCAEEYFYSSRTCHCLKGFTPHPQASETCVRPCDLQYCGINATCINNANGQHFSCLCNQGYFPILHGTTQFQGCADPCQDSKCNSQNTVCIRKSVSERECLCHQDTVPVNGNAAANGCVRDPCLSNPCNSKNTGCVTTSHTTRVCLCDSGTLPINDNAAANGCDNDPCGDVNACGANTYCTQTNLMKMCLCKPGFYVAYDTSINVEGCRGCPDDWIKNGTKCYFVSETMEDKATAKTFCEDAGGYLAEPIPTNDGITYLLEILNDNFNSRIRGAVDPFDPIDLYIAGTTLSTNDVYYETSGMFISSASEIFSVTAPAGGEMALTIKFGDDNATPAADNTVTLPFVCEFAIPPIYEKID